MPGLGVAQASELTSQGATDPAMVQKELFTLLQAQITAITLEDVPAAVSFIHPHSPLLAPTESMLQKVSAGYDLKFTLSDLALESLSDEEAQVRFTQLTEKTAGPQFRSNRVLGIHTFKKFEGRWKIYETKILEVKYLDTQ